MKKFLALLIALATVFSLCFSLTSCNIIKEDEVEECEHVDKDNDNRCDDCDEKVKNIHKHKDGDKDYVCDDCDEVLEYGKDDSDTPDEPDIPDASSSPYSEDEWRALFDFDNITVDCEMVEVGDDGESACYTVRLVDERFFISYDNTVWYEDSDSGEEFFKQFNYADSYDAFEYYGEEDSTHFFHADQIILATTENDGYVITEEQNNIGLVTDDLGNILGISFVFERNAYYNGTLINSYASEVSLIFYFHGSTEIPEGFENPDTPDEPTEPSAVTEDEWKSAHAFTNAKMHIIETVYYGGRVFDSYDSTLLVHDSLAYNAAAVEQFSPLEAYVVYFAFANHFSSFALGVDGKYRCEEVSIDGLVYKNVVVAFDDAKNLSSVSFDTNNGYYDFTISVEFSDHGAIEKPERAPFEPNEGNDYCDYYTERDVEGHDLAYVTITIKGYGEVRLLLDATTAPETVMHFLKLVNEGFYDGLTFHRVIDEFMIQGGDPNANGTGDYRDKDGNKVTIKGEFSSNGHQNDILHLRGVISMARGSDKNSASCQFFICNATADWLDGNYAAFGYVIDGMSVIDHVTYDTYVYGDANGTISDKTKQAVIESIVIDELVGITMDDIIK